mmetsp:Transcript_13699/g.15727  ORF Transcript_13699/g.15727 Transcript_13699/m.15727 type:complete len:89 (+) Transcript_13699:265-531(+)
MCVCDYLPNFFRKRFEKNIECPLHFETTTFFWRLKVKLSHALSNYFTPSPPSFPPKKSIECEQTPFQKIQTPNILQVVINVVFLVCFF